MDGDRAPLADLRELCQKYDGFLVIDEAHSIGAYGPAGRGLLAEAEFDLESMIAIYPCGKAMGGQGAFVCGPTWFRQYLINTARSFIYTTAPSPWMAKALNEVIRTMPQLDSARKQLMDNGNALAQGLRQQGWKVGSETSHIIPILLGNEEDALKLQSFLEARGIITKAIRPPTVKPGECRLRLSVNSGISTQQIKLILETFHAYQQK